MGEGKLVKKMIPIFIISCDRLKALEQSIRSYHDNIKTPFEIIIVDFGSTFIPTLKYLRNLEDKKIKVYWRERIFRKKRLHTISISIKDYFGNHPKSNYVVTDPDIALDNVNGDILEVYTYLLEKLSQINVAGPMLRIDDIPDCYPKKKEVINWEMRFHSKRKNTIQYKDNAIKYIFSRIDTTFGLHRIGSRFNRKKLAARVFSPYSARHLDWYLDPGNLTPDQEYYMKHASGGITNWSRWEEKED